MAVEPHLSDVTLLYKGSKIAELSATGNKTLKTAGKYCDADIELAYVKSGCEPVEPDLPNEYQRVEYLGITQSSAYFQISFSPIEINDIIEVEVMDTAATTSEQGFVGMYSGGSAWEIFFESGNIQFYGGVSEQEQSYEKNEKQTIRGRFTTRYAASSFNFGFYRGTYYFTGRLYGLRIYNGRSGYDKTITWCKLVPCYLKSNNTPGFYDLVNSVFYTRTGSGDVEIGPDVN